MVKYEAHFCLYFNHFSKEHCFCIWYVCDSQYLRHFRYLEQLDRQNCPLIKLWQQFSPKKWLKFFLWLRADMHRSLLYVWFRSGEHLCLWSHIRHFNHTGWTGRALLDSRDLRLYLLALTPGQFPNPFVFVDPRTSCPTRNPCFLRSFNGLE